MARLKLLANDGIHSILYMKKTERENITHFDSQAMDTGKIGKDKLSSSSVYTFAYDSNEIANP